jgi:site-specific recombinase XerD
MKTEKGYAEATIHMRHQDIGRLLEAFKDMELKDITISDIRAYLGYHKETQQWTSRATYIRHIESIREFFRFLQSEAIVDHNLDDKLKFPASSSAQRVIRYLTQDEIDRILHVLHSPKFSIQNKAIVHLLLSTGLRISELIVIKKNQYINLKERKIFIPKTKNRRPKYVKFSPIAQYYLEQWLIRDKVLGKYLFHQSGSGKLLTAQMVRNLMRKLIRLAFPYEKWEKPMGPHILRHTFAMDWIRHGGSLKGLQWIMGWSSLNTAEVYLHQSEEIIDDFYAHYESQKKLKGTFLRRPRKRVPIGKSKKRRK